MTVAKPRLLQLQFSLRRSQFQHAIATLAKLRQLPRESTMISTNMVTKSNTTNLGLQLKDSEDLATLKKNQGQLALLIPHTACLRKLMAAKETPLQLTWLKFQIQVTSGNAIRTPAADATCLVKPRLPTLETNGSVTKTQAAGDT